jgi:diaminohydroxyphosphoribosylaminopyrimidine deaminase / 5-amino-6-(5-phosphoribosylamino)uracil reductase
MKRAIDLARFGLGYTNTNPLVGAVIVRNNKIVSESYHKKYGEAHAEVNAILPVSKDVLKESSLYVNLEPCSHYGKTPPCANLIIVSGIKNVVIAMKDPFDQVNGSGVELLKGNGVNVTVGICEAESMELNKRFIINVKHKRPYIILKWAESKDGFISSIDGKEKHLRKISSESTQILVHKWRQEETAILVGINTILNDNPFLNNRVYSGRSPVRVIIDPHLKTPATASVFSSPEKIIIYCLEQVKEKTFIHADTEIIKLPFIRLDEIMTDLYQRNIGSVLVEGGRFTLEKFINANLWDEARMIQSDKVIISDGIKAPVLTEGQLNEVIHIDSDKLSLYSNPNSN